MFASSGCYSSILVNEIYSLVGRVNTWSLALLWNYTLLKINLILIYIDRSFLSAGNITKDYYFN